MKSIKLKIVAGTTLLSFFLLLGLYFAFAEGPGGPGGCYYETTQKLHGNMVSKNCGGGITATCCWEDPGSMNHCTKDSGQPAYLICNGTSNY
jgi:hypothetical protein